MRVLIAASGTGGHLFPALYIAEELKRIQPDVKIEFCGSGRPLEEQIIGSKGYKVNLIPIVGLSRRGISGLFEFILKLPRAWLRANKLVTQFKPDIVLGVGGYISVLPVLAAKLHGVPAVIHEAEKTPGMANQFLSRFVDLATTAHAQVAFKHSVSQIETGQPLNPLLYQVAPQQGEVKNILVLGGSQGAEALDQAMVQIASFLKERGLSVKHQCRKQNLEALLNSYRASGIAAQVMTFIDDMPGAYTDADLVITRSGANTVNELEVVGRQAIFVPLPGAPEQAENAEKFVAAFSGEIVEEGDNFADNLKQAILRLIEDKGAFTRTSESIVHPAKKIAEQMINISSKNQE